MLIKELSKEDRPRERLARYGVAALSNEELLSIILRTGTKAKSVRDLSSEILAKLSTLDSLSNYNIGWLKSIKGIGFVKACEILASIELGKRIYGMEGKDRKKITSAYDVYSNMRTLLLKEKQECFYCLYLNHKNEVLERRLIFMGTVNRSIVHPREVFRHAYLNSASSIICIHNHPSNDVSPSKEDITFTKALIEIGRLQAIPVLDHVIIGWDQYYSMEENLDLFIG